MGKRDRIKRSPSHSNSKIKLSIKELKEFVDVTSKSEGIVLNEESVELSSDEDQDNTFSDIQDSCEILKARRTKDADPEASIVASVHNSMGDDLTHNPSNPNWYIVIPAIFLV